MNSLLSELRFLVTIFYIYFVLFCFALLSMWLTGMLAHVCYAFSTVSVCPGAIAACRCVPSYRSAFVAVLSVVLFRLRSTVVDGDFESYSVAVETDEEGEDPFAISFVQFPSLPTLLFSDPHYLSSA